MENDLSITEEFDVTVEMQMPHLMYLNMTPVAKQKVAFSVMSRKPEDMLLINAAGFSMDAVFAGLTGEQVEYLALNAPQEYKTVLLEALKDSLMLKRAFKIAKDMDEDMGKKSNFHQKRFSEVVQYLKDNQVILNF